MLNQRTMLKNLHLHFLIVVFACLVSGCASLPPLDDNRPATHALTDTGATRLGSALAPLIAANPGLSGIHALSIPNEAFAARALLADAAEKSLDVQYYIWHGDQTGTLLFDALLRAADRGVRVRLLLDDNSTAGLDETLRGLNAHPNVSVRLYNPLAMRSARMLNFVTDFSRLNRRMHNKSFTADNQVTIVGGRNIGDEYFGASNNVGFEDLDVIASGPVVKDVSASFDQYWNSASAYPAADVIGEDVDGSATKELLAHIAAVKSEPASRDYVTALQETRLVHDLLAHSLSMQWANARLLVDDPIKTLDKAEKQDLLLGRLLETTERPEVSFDLVTPYFVPGEDGTEAFAALTQRKVKVRVLTNSLNSSDVPAVHAGYAKRREDLLKAGVQLYELKAQLASSPKAKGLHGSSSASLHAKTFVVDGRHVFVGSFNFDKRSAFLNTELGLFIDDPLLAGRIVQWLDTQMPADAYRVVLQDDGALRWMEQTPKGEVQDDTEPGTNALQRAWVSFLSILPIEWML